MVERDAEKCETVFGKNPGKTNIWRMMPIQAIGIIL